jgi:hypothetical protein
VKTVVFGVGRSLTTRTLVNVMFPVFWTVPLYVTVPPVNTGATGQLAVTTIWGVVKMGQVVVAEFATSTPQTLRAVAVEVLVLEQFVGAK